MTTQEYKNKGSRFTKRNLSFIAYTQSIKILKNKDMTELRKVHLIQSN